jgi:Fuc2NAc and GlcNAc transferase
MLRSDVQTWGVITFATVATGWLSYALTARVRSFALRRGVVDRPNDRSSHKQPTPLGGGAAVIAATIIGMAIVSTFHPLIVRDAFTVGAGMALLGVLGWLDDHNGIPARERLVVHFIVSLWTLYMLGGLRGVHVGSTVLQLRATGYLVGALGIVWSINLFNFMDGIDGFAGSQSALIFAVTGALLFWRGDTSLGSIAVILAAASTGFLFWNWPPAKIFMGDVGSGAIGYAIAALAIASENRGSVPLLAFAIVGGVFVSDATVTLVRRISRGKRPAEAHRDHAYQRLARAWASHRSVSTRAAALTIVLACCAAIATSSPRFSIPALGAACVLLGVLLVAAERQAPM